MRSGVPMRWLLLAVLATGCNEVYGIEETQPKLEDDTDKDDIPNLFDNCPTTSNTDQADIDEDTVGDRCDNCPLTPNLDQAVTGDSDLIGDACDPHPVTAGDCLVLFDTFGSPDILAHWTVSSSGAQPVLEANIDSGTATVVTPPNTTVFLLARDEAGAPLDGVFDGQLNALLSVSDGAVYLVSNAVAPSMGYGCAVTWDMTFGFRACAYVGGPGDSICSPYPLLNVPVSSSVSMRLTSETATDEFTRCRMEVGFAVGNYEVWDPTPMRTSSPSRESGAPGIRLYSMTATLDSIALYRSQPTACAPTIYR